jgi:hypothetical protein
MTAFILFAGPIATISGGVVDYNCVLISDIFPNRFWTRTVGVYRLATELRQDGHRVKVINGYTDFSPSELLELLKGFIGPETIWVGYSCTFVEMPPYLSTFLGVNRSQYPNSFFEIVYVLKSLFPHVKFLVGGTSASVRNYDFADYYVLGYADEEIVKLTNMLKLQHRPVATLIRERECIECSKEVDFNSRITRYNKEDAIFPRECLTIEFTRGCRFKCKFCSFPLNGRTANAFWKDRRSLAEELIRNYEDLGVSTYIIADDTFNESTEKLDYYLSVLEELPFTIQYSSFLRLDLLDSQKSYWDRLIKTGLRGAFFGIESLNHKAAQAIGKNLKPEVVIGILAELRKAWQDEVVTSGGFIAGLPYDTPEIVSSWLQLLRDPQFPLHNHHVQGLYITHQDTPTTWTSEFQKNSSHYGYRMIQDESNCWYWENDHWNFKEALALAKSHNNFVHNKMETPFDCFTHTIIMGYGLTHQEAFNMKQGQRYSSKRINHFVSERIAEYKKLIAQA